jgi:hypothetical protein
MPGRSGRINQLGGESLDPPIQGDVIDVEAALGEELLQIPVREAAPPVAAHREQNHIRREPEPRERRRGLNARAKAADVGVGLATAAIAVTATWLVVLSVHIVFAMRGTGS